MSGVPGDHEASAAVPSTALAESLALVAEQDSPSPNGDRFGFRGTARSRGECESPHHGERDGAEKHHSQAHHRPRRLEPTVTGHVSPVPIPITPRGLDSVAWQPRAFQLRSRPLVPLVIDFTSSPTPLLLCELTGEPRSGSGIRRCVHTHGRWAGPQGMPRGPACDQPLLPPHLLTVSFTFGRFPTHAVCGVGFVSIFTSTVT